MNRNQQALTTLLFSCVVAVAACGDDEETSQSNAATTSTSSTSSTSTGGSGGAVGSGGNAEGGSGTGGSVGGAGQGGAADGGAGGAGGAGQGGGNNDPLINGCTRATAVQMLSPVSLVWDFGHTECVIINAGDTVNWNVVGDFGFHPLNGGPAGMLDNGSPITSSNQAGSTATVTFQTAGVYPYYCGNHQSMQGVIYVQ